MPYEFRLVDLLDLRGLSCRVGEEKEILAGNSYECVCRSFLNQELIGNSTADDERHTSGERNVKRGKKRRKSGVK
jgi:hypothetical protein